MIEFKRYDDSEYQTFAINVAKGGQVSFKVNEHVSGHVLQSKAPNSLGTDGIYAGCRSAKYEDGEKYVFVCKTSNNSEIADESIFSISPRKYPELKYCTVEGDMASHSYKCGGCSECGWKGFKIDALDVRLEKILSGTYWTEDSYGENGRYGKVGLSYDNSISGMKVENYNYFNFGPDIVNTIGNGSGKISAPLCIYTHQLGSEKDRTIEAGIKKIDLKKNVIYVDLAFDGKYEEMYENVEMDKSHVQHTWKKDKSLLVHRVVG